MNCFSEDEKVGTMFLNGLLSSSHNQLLMAFYYSWHDEGMCLFTLVTASICQNDFQKMVKKGSEVCH